MSEIQQLKEEIASTIRHYNAKGWSPATSTNYSFKIDSNQDCIYVSRSGVDKSQFQSSDFITVNHKGEPIGDSIGQKPSAETLIHCIIYELFPETKVILHSHSVFPVLISALNQSHIRFEGYEVKKGFDGQTTHDNEVLIPIFENTQDMVAFSGVVRDNREKILHHSFIMRKHGTYAWGKNLFEAKRHLETLEYLCQCEFMMNK